MCVILFCLVWFDDAWNHVLLSRKTYPSWEILSILLENSLSSILYSPIMKLLSEIVWPSLPNSWSLKSIVLHFNLYHIMGNSPYLSSSSQILSLALPNLLF